MYKKCGYLIIALGLCFGALNATNAESSDKIAGDTANSARAESALESRLDSDADSSANITKADSASLMNSANSADSSENADKYGDAFKTFGDIAQFLPAASLGYALLLRDFVGAKQQVIGFVAVVATTHFIKYSLHFYILHFATDDSKIAQLSRRPTRESYEAFPSGHTAASFSAVGFLQKRYGARLGIPAALIASAVGISRVHSQNHTIVQVICGAMLGFFLSFLLTRTRNPHDKTRPTKPELKGQAPSTKTMLCEMSLLALAFL